MKTTEHTETRRKSSVYSAFQRFSDTPSSVIPLQGDDVKPREDEISADFEMPIKARSA